MIKKIEIQIPIISWETDGEVYGLIIKDSSGKIHFFDKDGTYDGWSMEVNINEN